MKGIVFILLICLAAGCGGEGFSEGEGDPPSPGQSTDVGIQSVAINPEALSLQGLGTTVQLTADVTLTSGQRLTGIRERFFDPVARRTRQVIWSPENPYIASVTPTGTVQAVWSGRTTIRATVDGVVGEATVDVLPYATQGLAVVGTTIVPPSATLTHVGESIRLRAEVFYSDGTHLKDITSFYLHPSGKEGGQLHWQSSDPAVAWIALSGWLKATGPGEAEITLTNLWEEGFPEATMTVVVLPAEEPSPPPEVPGEEPTAGTAPAPEPEPEQTITEEPLPAGADPFIDVVVSFEPGPGSPCSDPLADCPTEKVLGPPQGAGSGAGSFDVLSLGRGGEIVIEFTDFIVFDGAGADLIVFENPFLLGNGQTFAEPGRVSVSEDGVTFVELPCQTGGWPYPGCAGVNPVFANANENDIDPTDPNEAGGDGFDLAEVGLMTARFVKIRDVTMEIDCGICTSGFDLDAMAVVHGTRP